MDEIKKSEQLVNTHLKLHQSSLNFQQLCDSVQCSSKTEPRSNWLRMPEMGAILANKFEIPVISYNKRFSMSFFPYHRHYSVENSPIFIAFFNGNHFVSVHFNCSPKDIPFPPVERFWKEFRCTRNVRKWEDSFQTNFSKWTESNPLPITSATPSLVID